MPQEDMLTEEPEVHCIHSEMVDIEKVKPNPMNANVHPEDQIKMLAGVLRVNGWREAIVVSKLSGLVVKGHGRLETAKYLKLKKVPVEYQDYRTEQDELADLIADNRIAQHSYVDALGLGKLLKRISAKGQENLGYTKEEIDLFAAAEYVAPVATDRKFVVLETLKMTKEAKAVITHAVQNFCLRMGREMDWGEALAQICIQWQAAQPPMPEKAPEPKLEPKARKTKAGPAAASQVLTDGEERLSKFEIKLVAKTMLGDKEVGIVRPTEGAGRYYTQAQAVLDTAKAAKEKGKAVEASLKVVGGEVWITSIEEA